MIFTDEECLKGVKAEHSALSNELAQCQKELNAKQAKIDSLMLEYCPDEMTEAQFNKWGECQMPHGRADAMTLLTNESVPFLRHSDKL